MTEVGLKKIETAKKNGKWFATYRSKEKLDIPADLRDALMKNEKSRDNFNKINLRTHIEMCISDGLSAQR